MKSKTIDDEMYPRSFFCFDLLTAGLILGWFGLVGSIFALISSIVALESLWYDPSYPFRDNIPDQDVEVLASFTIALTIIDLIASGSLIIGTVKRNHLLIIPWLITTIGRLFIFASLIIVIFINLAKASTSVHAVLISSMLLFAFYFYSWLAMRSLYRWIRLNTPYNEYSQLIDSNVPAVPIYMRA